MTIAHPLRTEAESFAERMIVGRSPAIEQLRHLAHRVAQSNASVMINGPSGAGKEVLARAIHEQSARAGKPFVAINCGAIPADLMESELFGHERGAFTGAHARRIGRFEEANGGTLFLDEIGDMRFDMQVKLLRVLEERVVNRVGGTSVAVDVRIISATHQDIGEAVAQNRFRQDLQFRLGVLPIRVPSLAERTEDVPLLVEHFQKQLGGQGRAHLSKAALDRLEQHDWPGNVRELRNFVERANVLFGGVVIGRTEVEQLLGCVGTIEFPTFSDRVVPFHGVCEAASPGWAGDAPINLRELLETMELERIKIALDTAEGVVSEAARLLTLKRTTLIEKMRKYSLAAA